MWLGPTVQLAPLAILALVIAFPVSLTWHARRGRMLLALRLATADALLVGSVLVILRATLPSTEPSTGLGSWTWMPFEDLIRAWPLDWARAVILEQMAANVLLFVPVRAVAHVPWLACAPVAGDARVGGLLGRHRADAGAGRQRPLR